MIKMQYVSTRDVSTSYMASQAIIQGLAPDGGLMTPFYIPKLPGKALEDLKSMSYQHRAVYIMKQFLEEFSVKELTDFAAAAYGPEKFDTPAVAPVRSLDGNTHCLELWHGPTCAFKDYALRGYDENSGILESDWYNAQVELLRLGSEIWGNGLVQIEAGVFSLMRWYEYTITLEPGQTLKNAVTAPLYPAIDADYTPSIYAYTYLLSPAKTWTQFGELDITVNTPYYMTECGIDGFTRTDGGYALTLPGLPEGELTFTLSEAERPQPPKRSILHLVPTELIIVPAAVLVAVAAVFLPARRKRRTKR